MATVDWWNRKESYARTLTVPQLHYAINDCLEAAESCESHDCARAGQYRDEASIYRKEMRKRTA
jgi:hypothetical protein